MSLMLNRKISHKFCELITMRNKLILTSILAISLIPLLLIPADAEHGSFYDVSSIAPIVSNDGANLTLDWSETNNMPLPDNWEIINHSIYVEDLEQSANWYMTIKYFSDSNITSYTLENVPLEHEFAVHFTTAYTESVHNRYMEKVGKRFSYTTTETIEPTKKKSGGCSDCTPPTIEDLQILNGTQWFTPTDKVIMNIGEPQSIKFKVYENKGNQNLGHLHFGVGVEKQLHHAESNIEVQWLTEDIGSISIDDTNKLFLENSTSVTSTNATCSNKECIEFIIDFTLAEKPDNDSFVISVHDSRPNSDYQIFPVKVQGDTTNPQPTITFYNKYPWLDEELLSPLTKIDKVNDLWKFESGVIIKHLGNNVWESVK